MTAAVAVALVIGAFVTVGGLASSPWRSETHLPVSLQEWQADGPVTGADVRAHAEGLFTSFAGTAAQQDDLEVIHAYEGNAGMDRCMSDEGFPQWDWSLSRGYAFPDDPLKTSDWLAMPMGRLDSRKLVASKPFLLAERLMNAPETSDYSDAVSACLAQDSFGHHRNVFGSEAVRAIERLDQQWWQFTSSFESAQLPDPDEYVACMRSADLTIMRGVSGDEPFETMLAYAMSGAAPADEAIPTYPDDPAQWNAPDWQKFLGLEDEFDRADWACRRDVYARHIEDLDPAMDRFAENHAEEIAQAVAFWVDVEARARALGFTGQRGSLEGVVGSS